MKKMLVSDYDKTFYLNDNGVEINVKAVEKFRKENNLFVIATGRNFYYFKQGVNQYNINYDYAILNHGGTIIDKNDKAIFNCFINDEIVEKIKKDICLDESVHNFWDSGLDSFVDKNLTKINVCYENKEKAMQIRDYINSKYGNYVVCYYVATNTIEIVSNKVNKSNAISMLLKKENLDNNNVYSIGDGYSDIEMIKNFNGYCMKECVEELKEVAISEKESVSELVDELLKGEQL